MSEQPLTVSVVVPTYRRPEYLRRCLEGLAAQTRPADEIVVVRREEDDETPVVLDAWAGHGVREATVAVAGQLAAMEAGVAAARGAVIAFTDDDAVPRPAWLERLLVHFEDPAVGAVGGRDVVQTEEEARKPLSRDVGRIGRWGRLVGNHHLGAGPARQVMILKGVDMAFRREALAFPAGLHGAGAQVHMEIAMCAWTRARGWCIVYDPAAELAHFVGPRFDADRRLRPEREAVRDAAYNLVSCLLAADRSLFWRRAAYGLLVGDRASPGLVRAAAAVARGERDVPPRLVPSLAGQLRALRDASRRPIRMSPAEPGSTPAPRLPTVVLVAHDIHDHGGMERAFAELIRRGRRETRFVVVSHTLADDLQAFVEWRRIRIPERPFPAKFAAFYLLAAGAVRRERGLVHTLGAIVPNRAGVATIQFCHAGFVSATGRLAPPEATLLRRVNTATARLLSLAAERWSYRPGGAAVLAAVSPGVKAELERHYPGAPVRITPNGVDVDRFRPDADVRRRLRREQRVGSSEILLLFVGGDWDRKGLDVAIGGLARARRHVADLRLWVVGTGDEERMRGLAGHEGVGDRIHFLGPQADTERYYQAADIFVLPTLYETFSLVAYEAAASGLPVVATRVSGIEDLVGEDEAGLLVQRTAQAFGEALARLAADAKLRRSLGETALRRSQDYTWQRSARSVLDVYAELAGAPAVTPACRAPGLPEPVSV